MNGINNNISNANYGSFGNNAQNNPKDEKSLFDEIIDSVKDFFDGDEDSKASSESSKLNSQMANIDRAYLNSRMEMQNSYTLTPVKKKQSLADKWAKDNENVELKQKENEIMNLKQKVGVLENRNKVLAKQNEFMTGHMNSPQTKGVDSSVEQGNQTTLANTEDSGDMPVKTYSSAPTHTAISKAALEKQQNSINEFADGLRAQKQEEKIESEKEERLEEATYSEQSKEQVKA